MVISVEETPSTYSSNVKLSPESISEYAGISINKPTPKKTSWALICEAQTGAEFDTDVKVKL